MAIAINQGLTPKVGSSDALKVGEHLADRSLTALAMG